MDYPDILIVLLDGKQFKNFKLENNIYILCNNGQDIIYYLISFIETDSNTVYIDEDNKWYKYIENNKIESADYKKKNPIVLFYKLTDRKYINKIINDNKNDINKSRDFKNLNNRIINANIINFNENNNRNNINIMGNHNNMNNNNIFNNLININNNNMNNNLMNINNNNMNNNMFNNLINNNISYNMNNNNMSNTMNNNNIINMNNNINEKIIAVLI